ncbi:hypothetical protein GUITHDRAFT_99283 [Guillardia theta CCMP2712]|uniref:Uncharacterized protein n=1 Tax=Guillardia theta (strain CCMP2712) TaxID=905079 RepID=L1K564_GUITC|nr:hypothetical protein GUITHDRAFT_99283 [Guillardia theta CCMP2712]EKX55508.1 hypothetical protein GUITHDRAFT_99283 [Guillardia theta CCMP2712]|eukprot:XP_005842488.1 hypothetical protein GUITHDRAFT_99283 [Guillardia theta CCMP2712]
MPATASACRREKNNQTARNSARPACPDPSSRSFSLDQSQRRRSSWARGPFSASCSSVSLPDPDSAPVITLTHRSCPAWLLGVVCKGPHFRSIDQHGSLTDGGAYERLGKSARACLAKSISRDGNFTSVRLPTFHQELECGGREGSSVATREGSNGEEAPYDEGGEEEGLSGRYFLE